MTDLAIELGGTWYSAVAVDDGEQFATSPVVKISRPAFTNPLQIQESLRSLADLALDGRSVTRVGVSTPSGNGFHGLADPEFDVQSPTKVIAAGAIFGGLIRDGRAPHVPLREVVALACGTQLGNVTVLNDGLAAVAAEFAEGVAEGVPNCAEVILSTGFGVGIMEDGAVLEDAAGLSLEPGHITMENLASPAPCGDDGKTNHPLAAFSGGSVRYVDGPPPLTGYSMTIRERWISFGLPWVAMSLAPALERHACDLMVVRGSLGVAWFNEIKEPLQACLRSLGVKEIEVVQTTLGDNAGLRGALATARGEVAVREVDWTEPRAEAQALSSSAPLNTSLGGVN